MRPRGAWRRLAGAPWPRPAVCGPGLWNPKLRRPQFGPGEIGRAAIRPRRGAAPRRRAGPEQRAARPEPRAKRPIGATQF